MAIENINTLQGNILDSYKTAALVNLGQRMGTKGDSVVVSDFTFNSIVSGINANTKYVVLKYNTDNGELLVYNNGISFITNDDNSHSQTITPIEYIGGEDNVDITFTNCTIHKTNNSYVFIGNLVYANGSYPVASNSIVVLEFNAFDDNYLTNKDCLIIDNVNSKIYHYKDQKEYTINNVIDSFNYLNIADFINEEINKSNINNTEIGDSINQIFEYFFAVLPKYIVNAYNNLNYNYDDNVGLKIEILKTIIKTAYSESNAIVDNATNPFYIYIPVDFKISFYTNENTGEYYDSLPVNVKFVKDNGEGTPISDNNLFTDAENNNYIIVDSNIDKASAYKVILTYTTKFSVSNLTTIELENITIRADKLYSIPYIGNDNYWYINDVKTEITATGKDAGNPNIIVLQTNFTDTQNTDYNTSDINDVYFKQDGPKTLHTYAGIDIGKTNENYTFNLVNFNYKLNYDGYEEDTNTVSVNESPVNTYLFKVKLPELYNDTQTGLVHDINFDSIIKNSLVFYVVDTRLSYFYNDSNTQLNNNSDIDELRKTSLQYKLTNNNSEQSFITVLFRIKFDNDTNKYIWEPLTNEATGTVLDLGSMISSAEFAELFTKITFVPDKYKFSYLILDKVDVFSKNTDSQSLNTDSESLNIFPIIKNDNYEYYETDKVDTTGNTATNSISNIPNNTNITPKFATISNIDYGGTDYLGEEFNINDINVSEKFIKFGGDDKFAISFAQIKENKIDNIPLASWSKDGDIIHANVYPMFDFREVITTNQTAMNRLSLISLASSGVAYNAYIGNSANSHEEGTLYIGSSPTNYSMAGNKTVTDDYGEFKTYNKINFELPVETNNLTIYKADDNKYFTYINVAVPSSSYISTITHTISTKYMTETYAATYKTYTLNAYSYISNTYSGFINATSIPTSVKLSNVTYDGESLPKSLLFIVNFNSYSNGKYNAESIEQIASSDSIIEGITNVNTTTPQMLDNNDETDTLQVDPFLLSVLEDDNEPTSEVIIEE